MVLLVVMVPWTITFVAQEIVELFVFTEISGKVQLDWSVLRPRVTNWSVCLSAQCGGNKMIPSSLSCISDAINFASLVETLGPRI